MSGTGLLLYACAVCIGCTGGQRDGVRTHGVLLNEYVLDGQRDAVVLPSSVLPGAVRFEDPDTVLAHVLAAAPAEAAVLPSEGYYYYSFPLGSRVISGNIRFSDLDLGLISIGYFDTLSPGEPMVKVYTNDEPYFSLNYDPEQSTAQIEFQGQLRLFRVVGEPKDAPQYPLYPGEQYIAGVLDESGYYLHLFYWPTDRSFYYVLNPERPRPETLHLAHSSGPVRVWFGERSRFCFAEHRASGRLVLVGVLERHVRDNTWYDGPFDQVPPRLNIQSILEEAYPYVIDAGGIDQHGQFLRIEGQRIAISPYRSYTSGQDYVEELQQIFRQDMEDPSAWTTATYEWKKDWRAEVPVPGDPARHDRPASSAWPANHWGTWSRGWSSEHQQPLSLTWPPNHTSTTSANK